MTTTSAADLDRLDVLAPHRALFLRDDDVAAYLDGNSLGRPLLASRGRIADFIAGQWGSRLIRGWDESWLELPTVIGDDLGRVVLGAAPGQVTIGDSTTVLLYKLIRAAVDARPGRTELAIDRANFPTDRYIVEGIAEERGLTVRWIDTDAAAGVTPEIAAAAITDNTAVVVLSHVAYRSGYLAEVPTITAAARAAGALVVWDLSHSVGVVPTELDAWGVDLAVGCTYKYLNGGPGSPAFAYVRAGLQGELRQPIQGWLGTRDAFAMGQGYEPADGIRGFTSGTPPVLGMLAMRDMIALIESVGIDAVRTKSEALTAFAVELADDLLPDARLASPRDADMRGSHITLDRHDFGDIVPRLWDQGVIPDFRGPDGIRIGLSPLSTSFAEVEIGMFAIAYPGA
ncbi:kynureninase [Marisediminicola senii]|uniref:kynureninase n=1 Tax=Marisediminicola senii TaxID=2711233 RepID=UPI0013E9CC2E|nr:aminotransferase class V-fold PLP-dependent enzyme [Marisediminicola senii]